MKDRFVCRSCARDKPLQAQAERPKGKPPMCKSCAEKARERMAKS